MTDNEIIKALEDFIKQQSDGYQTHLAHGGKRDECQEKFLEILESFVEMFNRQKAEIERLKSPFIKMYEQFEGKIKAEAVKEFAERLKKLMELETVIYNSHIDNLVKEMVGDGNA